MTAAMASALPPSEKLPLRIRLGNGFGSIAYGVKDNGFATLLMLLYNQVLGLDARIVGLVLLLALFMDAIIDPMVGYWSDKTHSRWGKRHPWMYGSILPMAFAWIMLWHPLGARPAMALWLSAAVRLSDARRGVLLRNPRAVGRAGTVERL
ncbi:MFS transporter [Sphingopyxis sp. PET50]|uniref:MFS transporter n=1 Tax=Sphingopyxis sp. PET50 TaxID=2976533 RepID=UPI0021B0747E|nr:MFS transporter [Sphingopyxis sp. PET50]